MGKQMKFCVSCGEDVTYNQINRDGNQELTCMYCGMVLDVNVEKDSSGAGCIMTADDAPVTLEFLKRMLIKHRVAKNVIALENGQEFIVAFSKRLAEKLPIDLVILDLEMPLMDGITAARAMRSIEEKYQSHKIPILFFSARKCDEHLKKQLGLFTPASYMNKGSSNDPTHLINRVDRLVAYLLNKQNAATT
jgi:CheY-like chemotaxis protein